MKVKVGNKIYDGNDEPVMVILNQREKEHIANMPLDATKYCVYPSEEEKWTANDYEGIKQWMKEC